jgi:hypothetical protein
MCLNLWYGMGGGGCSIWIAFIVCVLLLLVIDSWAGVHGEGGLPAWLVLLLGGREGGQQQYSLHTRLLADDDQSLFLLLGSLPVIGNGEGSVGSVYLPLCVCLPWLHSTHVLGLGGAQQTAGKRAGLLPF